MKNAIKITGKYRSVTVRSLQAALAICYAINKNNLFDHYKNCLIAPSFKVMQDGQGVVYQRVSTQHTDHPLLLLLTADAVIVDDVFYRNPKIPSDVLADHVASILLDQANSWDVIHGAIKDTVVLAVNEDLSFTFEQLIQGIWDCRPYDGYYGHSVMVGSSRIEFVQIVPL